VSPNYEPSTSVTTTFFEIVVPKNNNIGFCKRTTSTMVKSTSAYTWIKNESN